MAREKSIYVRVSEQDKQKIARYAKRCNLTVSEYIRQRVLGYEPKEALSDFLLGWYAELCDFCNGLSGTNEDKLLTLIDEFRNEIFSKNGGERLIATTGFWPVKGKLKDVINYAENPDKTMSEKYLSRDLYNVLQYTENDNKTDKQLYVTAINCPAKRAYESMMATKRRFGKLGGNVAYHGFQSFAENEITPDEAHQIGIETAKRMWGDEYEIVITTHVHGTDNIHNHFCVNSVSFKTGRKFENHISDHYKLREISDAVCREHNKSILENRSFYGHNKKEHWVQNSYKDNLREDVNLALRNIRNYYDFERNMIRLGYKFSRNMNYAHPSVFVPGYNRPVRIDSLGEDYTKEAIAEYFCKPAKPIYYTPVASVCVRRNRSWSSGYIGILTLLFMIVDELLLRDRHQPQYEHTVMTPQLRAEIRKMHRHAEERIFIVDNNISTPDRLFEIEKNMKTELSKLTEKRNKISNKIRRAKTEEEKTELKLQRTEITSDMEPIRKQLKLIDGIKQYVPEVKAAIEAELTAERQKIERSYDR